MDVYLRAKFDVSSVILTGFTQGGGGNFAPPHTLQNEPLKKPTQIRINSLHSHLHLLLLFQSCLLLQTLASNLHLHFHISCYSICLVSLVLDIRLKTLTFKFFTTSATPIFSYGPLTLLQLPPHLLVLILKG